MYQVVLGKVSTLSAGQLPDALIAQAPQGVRRASWLAGRVLLSRALSPLPEMVYGEQGKPAFSAGTPLWFNLSHSGDTIALLLSDEGEVGCDIEVIRRAITGVRWQMRYSASANMLKWKRNVRSDNWRPSGVSGRVKKPS